MKSQKGTLQEGKNARLKDSAKPVILFLIIGGLLLWISYLLRPQSPQDAFVSNALSQAAFVVLTVTIVNFLWILLGGDPITNALKLLYETLAQSNDLLRDSHRTGVIAIFAKSDALSSNDWIERLRSAKDQVDLM